MRAGKKTDTKGRAQGVMSMNKYEIIGIIETKKTEIKEIEAKAERLSLKIKKLLNDSWWEVSLKNAQWLRDKADELFALMQKAEQIKGEIEFYRNLQKQILEEEV